MVRETRSGRTGSGSGALRRIQARAVFTVLGIAALFLGAALNWEAGLAGNKLSLRSLIQDDFTTRNDVLRTLAAACVVIAAVALLSLLDPSAWLTRLAGLAAVVVFAMFAVQVFRHHGENFSTSYQALRPGAWSELGAGVLLLLGGLIRYRRKSSTRPEVATQAVTERDAAIEAATEPEATEPIEVERTETEPDAFVRGDERDELDRESEKSERGEQDDEESVLTTTAEKP
jgi:hypothetical protein